jgi:hypothetical protein
MSPNEHFSAANVKDPKYWDCGDLMAFDNFKIEEGDASIKRHRALGVVIAKHDDVITVLWQDHCAERISNYVCDYLNTKVIFKVR